MRHSTFAGNWADNEASSYYQNGTNASLTIGHTLMQTGYRNNYTRAGGTVTNEGFNLANDFVDIATVAANLGLGPLTNNGGTLPTHALLPGSPAIDAGSSGLANAWQITDASGVSGSLLSYTKTLSSAQRNISTNTGWRMTVVSRLVDGSGLAGSAGGAHHMLYGHGGRRFAVSWDFNSQGQLFARMDPFGVPFITNLTTSAYGANAYHRHELVFNPETAQATYLFDGTPVRTWPGEVLSAQNGQIWWGANSSAGKGRMNYHSVQFVVNALGTVAEYKAGLDGNPVIAPDPTNQAWTVFGPTAPGTVASAPVSPDTETLSGIALGYRFPPFDERGPGYTRLFGSRFDIGAFELRLPTVAEVGLTPQGFGMSFTAGPNELLTIEWNVEPGSTGWEPLTTGTTDATGFLYYTDPVVVNQTQRFYRAVRP